MESTDKLSSASGSSSSSSAAAATVVPPKHRRSFLYKLFHRKRGVACLRGNDTDTDEHPEDSPAMSSPNNNNSNNGTVDDLARGNDIREGRASSENFIPDLPCQSANPSLSRDSQFDSFDSIKRTRELFFDPTTSRVFDPSESDSGCPDEDKKACVEEQSERDETFIRISSHAFRQLQNEVTFLRKQLVNLQQLFYSGCEPDLCARPSSRMPMFSTTSQQSDEEVKMGHNDAIASDKQAPASS